MNRLRGIFNGRNLICECGRSDFITRYKKVETGMLDHYLFYSTCNCCGSHWVFQSRVPCIGRSYGKPEYFDDMSKIDDKKWTLLEIEKFPLLH